jgi:2-dehydro-3-deoxyphosphogalactonate aldolase
MQRNNREAMVRQRWQAALQACPVVAILRGIKPEEALNIGKALVHAGITIIEVPTNSPNAFESVRLLVEHLPTDIVVGAGTCLTEEHVEQVAAAGATLVVSPNVEEEVIRRSKTLGLICLPGVATPTEAFAALKLGATGLKAFPGEQIPPQILKAWKAVLPKDVTLLAVGGVTVDNAHTFWNVGVNGFGIGTAIYKPGLSAEQVQKNAASFVSRIRELKVEQNC